MAKKHHALQLVAELVNDVKQVMCIGNLACAAEMVFSHCKPVALRRIGGSAKRRGNNRISKDGNSSRDGGARDRELKDRLGCLRSSVSMQCC
jgi:hypothetical protein